jgi:hypothetical protein
MDFNRKYGPVRSKEINTYIREEMNQRSKSDSTIKQVPQKRIFNNS